MAVQYDHTKSGPLFLILAGGAVLLVGGWLTPTQAVRSVLFLGGMVPPLAASFRRLRVPTAAPACSRVLRLQHEQVE